MNKPQPHFACAPRYLRGSLALAVALQVTGCAREVAAYGSGEWKQEHTVFFEACLPDQIVKFDRRTVDYSFLSDPRLKGHHNVYPELIPVAPPQVDWVDIGMEQGQFPMAAVRLEETTQMSDGSQMLELAGSTSIHQPVFRSGRPGAGKASDYYAVGLSITVSKDRRDDVVYWFKVPKLGGAAAFTPWIAPSWVGRFSDMTFWELMHGRPVDKTHVPPQNAPRLRFEEVTNSDFYRENTRVYQAKYAAWLQYAPNGKFQESYVAAPVVGPIPPGC